MWVSMLLHSLQQVTDNERSIHFTALFLAVSDTPNCAQERNKMFLILELCSGGDLTKFMQKRGGRVPEAVAHKLMQQLAAGLREMRALNLVHVSCLRPL